MTLCRIVSWQPEKRVARTQNRPLIFRLEGVCVVTAIKVLGDDLLSRARCTLPLALVRFTSEFGMGSGGTTPLWSPSKRVELGAHVGAAASRWFDSLLCR